jgi:hypothetical protein
MLCAALAGCGQDAGGGDDARPVPLQQVLDDADDFDGRRVVVTTGYYGSFEISVLTTGFAESFPPQPVEPLVWVNAAPPDACTEVEEFATWAEGVVATGVLETGGGFGHLGQYEFELTEASIRCS